MLHDVTKSESYKKLQTITSDENQEEIVTNFILNNHY